MRVSFSIPNTWSGRLVTALVAVAVLAGFVFFFFVAALIALAVLVAVALVRKLMPSRKGPGKEEGRIISGEAVVVEDADGSQVPVARIPRKG